MKTIHIPFGKYLHYGYFVFEKEHVYVCCTLNAGKNSANDTWGVASCVFVLGSILHISLNEIRFAIYFILAGNVY